VIEDIKSGDLIITKNHIKEEILRKVSKEKKLVDCKFLTLENFKKTAFDYSDEQGLYHIMKNFHINYSSAKEYLKNIYIKSEIIEKYYEFLKEEKLLKKQNLPVHNRLIVIGYDEIEPIIKRKLDELNAIYIEEKEIDYNHEVYEFSTQTKELTCVLERISEDLKKININDMYLVIPNEEYTSELNRMADLYNIPLEKKSTLSIYSTETVQTFLKELKAEKSIEKALDKTPKNEIYNQIIDVLNEFIQIKETDEVLIEIIQNELKKQKIKTKKLENSIKIITPDEVFEKSKHYYILGLNQNIIPKIHKDDEIIPDKDKEKLGLFTSTEKNKIETRKITKILKNYPNIYVSYKLEDNFQTYFPSSIIEDLNLEVIKNPKPEYKHSDNFNRLHLAILLDNYINYGEKGEKLKDLYETYKIENYKTYQNEYTKVNPNYLHEFLKNKYTLSYSSMNNYFLCPFKFYIENILKINDYEETFPILIGNLFHKVLENMDEEDFDIDKIFTKYLKEKELTPKDNYYINKLKNILKEDIEVIKSQDNVSSFKTKIKEKKITLKKDSKLDIEFIGVVDKISKLDDKVIITDYKTGSANATLENIDDGLNLQLPTYIYLIKNGLDKDVQIVGFYLQKLIHSKKLDEEENTTDNLKLNGYTIDDENIIEKIDPNYESSNIIKGMKKSSKGFYKYTKLISKKEIEKVSKITEDNIDKVIKALEASNFEIRPKRLKEEIISCKFCAHKEVCYRKEEDIKNLKIKTFKEIVGEENA